jgi:hypothetical protein
MASMTDSEILRVAQAAVPEHIRPLGRIVQRHDVVGAGLNALVEAVPPKDNLIADLAKQVGAKIGATEPDSADVEFPEQTALGLRSTVVHVRNGQVTRVLKRG